MLANHCHSPVLREMGYICDRTLPDTASLTLMFWLKLVGGSAAGVLGAADVALQRPHAAPPVLGAAAPGPPGVVSRWTLGLPGPLGLSPRERVLGLSRRRPRLHGCCPRPRRFPLLRRRAPIERPHPPALLGFSKRLAALA